MYEPARWGDRTLTSNQRLNEAGPWGVNRDHPQGGFAFIRPNRESTLRTKRTDSFAGKNQEQRLRDDDFTEQAGIVHFGDTRRNSETGSELLKGRLVRSCGTEAVLADNHPVSCGVVINLTD